jgi:serine/threonine protein kinase
MPLGLHTAELNFETIKEIGFEGRNSQVFLAHDKQLDGDIVVKKILKSSLINANDYYKEAKILYSSSHPNVVSVNYGCSDNDHIYIAMPYYKNGSLKSLIDSRFLSVREVIRYSLQFLMGLHNIHAKGLMHFDIKPDNILISDSNEALLSDFGLSEAMNQAGFAQQDLAYHKHVAPEAYSSTDKTVQYDIYQAGVTIYRLLNGNVHFEEQLAEAEKNNFDDYLLKGLFPSRKDYLPHVPKKMKDIVNKAISVDLTARYSTVLELMNDLSEIHEHIDWYYDNSTGRKWTKRYHDKTMEISIAETNPGVFDVKTGKTLLKTGRIMPEKLFTCNNLAILDVNKLLKKALKEL